MKTFLLGLIIISNVWANSGHQGHNHDSDAECEIQGQPSSTAEELASDIAKTLGPKPLKVSKAFCQMLWNCVKSDYIGQDIFEDEFEGLSSKEKADLKKEKKQQEEQYLKEFLEECRTPNDEIGDFSCGLSDEERSAILFYTGSGYSPVNQVLWGTEKFNCKPAISSINRALAKIPSYKGLVARGTTLPEKFLKDYVVGKTVDFPAFTSSSTDVGTAKSFAGNALFLIYSETGKPITSFSSFGDSESEVLFGSGKKFHVISNKLSENSVHHILLREVSKKESQSEAAKKNQEVLAKLQTIPDEPKSGESDNWACESNKLIKGSIQQTLPPALGKQTRDQFLSP